MTAYATSSSSTTTCRPSASSASPASAMSSMPPVSASSSWLRRSGRRTQEPTTTQISCGEHRPLRTSEDETMTMDADFPKIISVDDHVIEHSMVWQDRLPAKYQDVGPRTVKERGNMKFVGG